MVSLFWCIKVEFIHTGLFENVEKLNIMKKLFRSFKNFCTKISKARAGPNHSPELHLSSSPIWVLGAQVCKLSSAPPSIHQQ